MATPPNLLNDDGSASMATALLMSHHGLRRDIARFAVALKRVAAGDTAATAALRDEWKSYRETLHGHHEAEDTRLFPHLRQQQPSLAFTIDELTRDHRRIDPLLDRGDSAFADLPNAEAAIAVVDELTRLLDAHLATEEADVVPHLRGAKEFPPPANDAEVTMYADGFAWSSQGVAPDVLDKVYAMLPETLSSKLASARAAFDDRCVRAWGSAAAGSSRTAVPDR